MNAALSIILSLTTVLAGGAAALGGDLLSPHSLPADDCIVADVCTAGGHGNETSDPENGTSEPENGTADPEPEPAGPGNETGHHHHYHNETEHHHHYHNGTAGNQTAEPEGPEDEHFCTTGLFLLSEDYTFSWQVHEGFEVFELDWHYQSLAVGLVAEPDVRIELRDGAGNIVLEADGYDALSFSLGTEDLRGYAPGEWSFSVSSSELAAEQGLVGSVEY